MCIGPLAPNAPATPSLPPALPAARPPPTPADPEVGLARQRERRRAALASGSRVILTSGQGLQTQATTAPKTLLGT